jgi:Caulimovirus viroplasmin
MQNVCQQQQRRPLQLRQVTTMSARFQTKYKRHHDPVKKAECFAVAAGHQIGIFFTREEMMRCTKAFPERKVQSFATVSEAEAFLKQQGLVPIISFNGWLSTKKSPILYQHSTTPNQPCVRVTPTPIKAGKRPFPNNAIDAASAATRTPKRSQSSQSLISVHSSPENSLETPLKPSKVSNYPFKKVKGTIGEDYIDIDSDSDDAEQMEHSKASLPSNAIEFDTVQQQAINAGI